MKVLIFGSVFFLAVLLSISVSIANDVISVLGASARQCPAGGAINTLGKFALGIQDSSGSSDFILLNADGSLNTAKRITGSGSLNPMAITSTKDNGFVVVGSIHTSSAANDAIIMKFSSAGNLLWKKILGTPEDDEFRSVAVLSDGSIVVSGHRFSATSSLDLIVVRFSANGGLKWKKIVGTSVFEHSGGISVLPDDTFVLAAATEVAGVTRAFWTKFTASGTIVWSRIGSVASSAGLFYLPDQHGGFLLGFLAPLQQGVVGKTYVARFDAGENRLWAKSFGASGNSLNLSPGFLQPDGSFYLAGNAFKAGPGVDRGVIAKISASGVPKWKRSYSATTGSTTLTGLFPDGNSQFLIAPGCVNQGTDAEDISIVQLPLAGALPACSSLRNISFNSANVTFSWTNFSISKLPASFHVQNPQLSSSSLSITTSTVCP
jgi:hypothetical protein